MSDKDDARLLADLLLQARSDANKSQEAMALSVGVSKSTIINWERGTSAPNLKQVLKWFRECGLNPFPYMLQYVFPGSFDVSSGEDLNALRDALHLYVDSMPEKMLRDMSYITFGQHGSSSFSVVQMMVAHLHTDMRSRVAAARLIKENYEMCEHTGTLVCPDEVKPDLKILEDGILSGKTAVVTGASGYSLNNK